MDYGIVFDLDKMKLKMSEVKFMGYFQMNKGLNFDFI